QGAIVDPDTWTISGDFVAQSGIDERQVELVNERLQGAVIALNELEFDHMKVVERTERRIHVVIDPFPDEGRELYRTLAGDLGAILGRDTESMNAMRYGLHRLGIEGRFDFGAQEGHIEIETLDDGR